MKDTYNKRPRKNFKQPRKEGDNKAVAVNDTNKFAHIIPVQAQPLEVKVYNNNFDKALRAFRALVQKERILSTYKEKQSYEKPSDKHRRKRNEMKRKQQEINGFSSHERIPKTFKPRRSFNSNNSPE
jgi:ribosomal protein S21